MIYVLDRFRDTDGVLIQDHTPDIDVEGGGWSVIQGGPLSIESNRLFIPGATDWSAVVDPGIADSYIITGAVVAADVNGFYARILFRTIDINNWLAFQLNGLIAGVGAREITQRIAGVTTNLASSAPAPTGAGTYEFKITVDGTLITCEDVTNSIVLTAMGQFQTEQPCGLGNHEGAPALSFDDFRIESLPETPTAPTEVSNCNEAVWVG